MSDPHLLFERDGHVATVTLNRPEARNALSGEMLVRMHDAWVEIDEDPEIRVAHRHRRRRPLLRRRRPQGHGGRPPRRRVDAPLQRRPRPALEGAAAPLPAEQAARSPRSRATPWPAAPRSCRPWTSGWRGRAPCSAWPRCAEACSRWAAQHRPAPAPDPLHGRGRAAADRPPDDGGRGQGGRPHRPRRARRAGARPRPASWPIRSPPTARSPSRPSCGACARAPTSTEAEALANELELGWPVFGSNDAKEGPGPSRRSGSPTSRAPDHVLRALSTAMRWLTHTDAGNIGG